MALAGQNAARFQTLHSTSFGGVLLVFVRACHSGRAGAFPELAAAWLRRPPVTCVAGETTKLITHSSSHSQCLWPHPTDGPRPAKQRDHANLPEDTAPCCSTYQNKCRRLIDHDDLDVQMMQESSLHRRPLCPVSKCRYPAPLSECGKPQSFLTNGAAAGCDGLSTRHSFAGPSAQTQGFRVCQN